jgi:hypothetical protein
MPCPASHLFSAKGRELLERLALPDHWAQTANASLALIDDLKGEITECEGQHACSAPSTRTCLC